MLRYRLPSYLWRQFFLVSGICYEILNFSPSCHFFKIPKNFGWQAAFSESLRKTPEKLFGKLYYVNKSSWGKPSEAPCFLAFFNFAIVSNLNLQRWRSLSYCSCRKPCRLCAASSKRRTCCTSPDSQDSSSSWLCAYLFFPWKIYSLDR